MIKADLLNVFRELFVFEKFEKSLNAIFIALIPKKSGALESSDYRPISLVSVYKIISKVLANCPGEVLGKMILKLKMPLFVTGKFWILFLLPMNA